MSEPHNARAGEGAVVLDIGGDVGALVVEMPAAMLGTEVEIRRADDRGPLSDRPGPPPHVAVVARPTGAGPVPSLVFPALLSGEYHLAVKGEAMVRLTARVAGGRVTEKRWPG